METVGQKLRGNTMKVCTKCKEEKPLDQFYLRKTRGDGTTQRRPRCIPCSNADTRAYQQTEENREARRNLTLQKVYGITLEEYNLLLDYQGGGCAICGKKATKALKRNMYVDHDHDTGEVRGILCTQCNSGIGLLGDSTERLDKAKEYLTNPPALERGKSVTKHTRKT